MAALAERKPKARTVPAALKPLKDHLQLVDQLVSLTTLVRQIRQASGRGVGAGLLQDGWIPLPAHHWGQGAASGQVGLDRDESGLDFLAPEVGLEIGPAFETEPPGPGLSTAAEKQSRGATKGGGGGLQEQGAGAAEGVDQRHRAIPTGEGDQARRKVFLKRCQPHGGPIAAAVQAAAVALQAEDRGAALSAAPRAFGRCGRLRDPLCRLRIGPLAEVQL
jgi:hypothetical protein